MVSRIRLRLPQSTFAWIVLLSVSPTALAAPAEESLAARRQMLESLTAEEKQELSRKKKRFEGLSKADQKRLRDLHLQLSQADDKEQLLDLLNRYYVWLSTQSASQQAQLRSLPPAERIAKVKALLEEDKRERFQNLMGRRLPPEDQERITQWLERYMETNTDRIVNGLPPGELRGYGEHGEPNQWILRRAYVRNVLWPTSEGRKSQLASALLPSTEDWSKLEQRLSDEAKSILKEAEDEEEKLQLFCDVTCSAHRTSHGYFPRFSPQEMQRFISKLEPEELARLESMSRSEMMREVAALYLKQRYGPSRFSSGWPRNRGGSGNSGGPGGRRGGRSGIRGDGPGGSQYRDGPMRRGSGPFPPPQRPDPNQDGRGRDKRDNAKEGPDKSSSERGSH